MNSVSISGKVTLVGDAFARLSTGVVHVYEKKSTGIWTQVESLVPEELAPQARFGLSLDIDGDTMVVGAYVYRRINNTWTLEEKLSPEYSSPSMYFDGAVSVKEVIIAVGARYWGDEDNEKGSVFVYKNGSASTSWQ